MRRVLAPVLVAGVVCAAACSGPNLPEPVPPPHEDVAPDAGFPIAPRPGCSADVMSAIDAHDPAAVGNVGRRGGVFTCGPRNAPLPLDDAVFDDDPAMVRALLQAGADPNARWSSHGDRFPLQDAIESRAYGMPGLHRIEIVRLLLQHGANPNARWCPFESRGASIDSCRSAGGVTPLMYAAALDQPDVMLLLLDAGADPRLEDGAGADAFDYAHTNATMYLLLATMFSSPASRARNALNWLEGRQRASLVPGPWDETPLGVAIAGVGSFPSAPPPPAPARARPGRLSKPPSHQSFREDRVQLLLTLGADPNRRLTWSGVDWTPLALAVAGRDLDVVNALLGHGADPNARWCSPVWWRERDRVPAPAGCTIERGTTPLMLAASQGDVEVVTVLAAHGADVNARDWQNRTALDLAPPASREEVASVLRTPRPRSRSAKAGRLN